MKKNSEIDAIALLAASFNNMIYDTSEEIRTYSGKDFMYHNPYKSGSNISKDLIRGTRYIPKKKPKKG